MGSFAMNTPALVLSTLNARYAHASLGLRYLFANLDEDIRAEAKIVEFVIGSKTEVLVEQLLADRKSTRLNSSHG